VTFSFYARKGANFSGTTVATYINTGTGTDQAATGQNAGTWTGFTSPLNGSTFTPTTTWTRYSFNATIGATATQIGLGFLTSSFSGTAGAADFVEITGLQLERGSVATTFKRSNGAGGTIQGELAACQRYYYRSTSSAGSQTSTGISGITNSTTNLVGYFNPPVSMRVTPTAVDFSSIGTQTTASGLTAISAVAIVNESTNNSVSLNLTSSGFLANLFGLVRGTTGTGYIGLSAEL
jgi:hypothetical protein